MYREVHADRIGERAASPAIASLLATWTSLRERHDPVPYEPFSPRALGPLADNLIVLVLLGDGDAAYVHYGRALVALHGVDLTGRRHTESKSPTAAFFRDVNQRAIAERVPLFSLHRGTLTGNVHLWERLVLPCRSHDGADVLVVYSTPREFNQDLLGAILEASLDGIIAVRLMRRADGTVEDGEVIVASRRAAEMAGTSIEDLTGVRLLECFPALRTIGLWLRFVEVAETRVPAEFVTAYPRRAGGRGWFEIACVPLGDGFMLTFADITARRRAEKAAELKTIEYASANAALKAEIARRRELEAELSRLAAVDALTGTMNRRALSEGLQRELTMARRHGHAVAVIVIDLDHFKHINDTFGHQAGDAALQGAADVLKRGVRAEIDLVGRLGGEEFVVVLPRADVNGALIVAERLRGELERAAVLHDGRRIGVTGSFGVAAWDGAEQLERLLSRADAALYRAKAAGRNRLAADCGEEAPEAPLSPAEGLPAFRECVGQD